MTILRAVGDCHGCLDHRKRLPNLPSFIEICESTPEDGYVVQVGDLGFNYKALNKLDANKVRVVLGNHECYDTAFNYTHMLGDFGLTQLGPFQFFFVRGGFSIDKMARIRDQVLFGHKSWWQEEELTHAQGLGCLQEYETIKPNVVMSHDCPASVSSMIGNPEIMKAFGWQPDLITSTQELLEQMFDIHKPKLWIHGHYHRDYKLIYKGVKFIGIAEREFVDFDTDWNVISESLSDERKHIFL